jgi:ferredoxin
MPRLLSVNVGLELAEACDVPVRWSCRTGVCHTCMIGLIAGSIAYNPEPLERPAPGNLLVCFSQPNADVSLDLKEKWEESNHAF